MAEAIVNLVLGKLADAVVRETLFPNGAGSKLDSLQHELRWIRAFVKDTESKHNCDERVKTWVSDVREVAYRIEDAIDTFMAEVDDQNRPCIFNLVMRVLKKPRLLPINHKLICEMDEIQVRLREIKECTNKYGIKELGDSSKVPTRSPHKEFILPDMDDPDVVGLETDKENIVDLLLAPNMKRRCVLSIVGQGGLGKTTLARKVYNSYEVKKEFKFRLWLSISQQFKLIDLLKTMLDKIRPVCEDEKALLQKEDPVSQQRAKEHFITELNMCLKKIKYLIIMDDVWTQDLWIQLKEAFPDVRNGSRVLLTTRSSDIARRADPISIPYYLRYLNEEESQNLLLKKAFQDQDPQAYLNDLSDLPTKFARKCGGLPLALIVVGGLLSRQPPTYNSWHKILEKLSWHIDDGKMCTEILATSYEHMPAELKPCFMYFASFPEDYTIKAKSLIRMWVAEGFIPEVNNRTMEETAEDYLEELVQRSMIQVSWRFCNGSIKNCRIHDLLRDLAIEKAKENNFLKIISNQGGNYSSSSVRRAAVHCNNEDITEYTGPSLRSLLYFVDLPNIANFRLLKVLCGMTKDMRPTKGETLNELTQLRYLMIYSDNELIWKSISQMRNLQTLDIPEGAYQIPDCIWDIKTLRHVILPMLSCGPPSTAHLPNLQTLKIVEARESWLTEGWPKMPNIRVLWLRINFPEYGESIYAFLCGLRHLTSLHMTVSRDGNPPYEILDMSTFPSYNHMQSLCLKGKWSINNTFDISLIPVHLTKLILWFSEIEEDPMPVLEKLESLRVLKLYYNAYKGKQLNCSSRGFRCLETLVLRDLEKLEEWKIEEGGMPMLKGICITYCRRLRMIPDLQHMIRLKKLTIKYIDTDILERLRGQESYKIKNIPSIDFLNNLVCA